jgi:quercetin dioxygenase-like cupin family protein
MNNSIKTIVKNRFILILSLLFYPVGVYQMWKKPNRFWNRLIYTVLGLPIFIIIFSFIIIITLAAFLAPLDMTVGDRQDRELFNSAGNYGVNFLKTGKETNGSYELVRVDLEPSGGNDWHYHKLFDEQFTVEEGEMIIGLEGKEMILKPGETITAKRNQMHFFKNASATSKAVLLVKSSPAMGLEKTIRVGYGLANDGEIKENGFSKNPWHMALLMGYSGSYLQGLPSFIQEPLVNGMAKIAQWKGEDKTLEKYFR